MSNLSLRTQLRAAALVLAAVTALVAPAVVHASRGSILPSSLVTATFGANPYPADVRWVGDRPCALVGFGASTRTMELGCGARLASRYRLDVTAFAEFPASLDVGPTFVDVAGLFSPTATTQRPLLVRLGHDGARVATFGTDGVANLDAVAPLGLPAVQLTSVESLADGSAIVVGIASASVKFTGEVVAFAAKVTPLGAIDPSYGESGVRVLRVPGALTTVINDARVMDDGTMLLVGSSTTSATGVRKAAAILLDPAGAPVSSFDGDGFAAPAVGPSGTALFALAESNAGTFPMIASGSANTKGLIRPFVVQLQASGALVAGWGGTARQTLSTMTGGPRDLQGMDIDVAPNGVISGAAEVALGGDFDSFVARFAPASGAPDPTYATGRIEQIDTRPGLIDNEYTAAMTLAPDGTPWVLGASTVKGVAKIHMFRTRGGSSSAKAPVTYLDPLTAKRVVLRCGSTLLKACKVKRGAPFVVGASMKGWDASSSALVRPVFHIWSKAPRKPWVATEKLGSTFRFGGSMSSVVTMRLPVGTHEISVTRNGGINWGATYVGSVYVKVA